jgi:hypothetical protein
MVAVLEVNGVVKDMQQYILRVKEWYQDERIKECRKLSKKVDRIADISDEKANKIERKIDQLRDEILADVHPKFKYINVSWQSFYDYIDGDITLKEFVQDTLQILEDINEYKDNQNLMFYEVLDGLEISAAIQALESCLCHDMDTESAIHRLRALRVPENEISSIINEHKFRRIHQIPFE